MPTLTYAQIETLMLEDLQANVATDPPITTGVSNEAGRSINDAYSIVWEISGGRQKRTPSATAWNSAQLCTGTVHGLLTDINEVLQVFATTTAPVSVAGCGITNTSPVITSAAGFGAVTAGMQVSGDAAIPSRSYVAFKTSSSNLTMTRNATADTTATLTFSPTEGPILLDRRELAEIHWLRANAGQGTYLNPKVCALVRPAAVVDADVNLVQLEYWPPVTGFYFPIHYVAEFTPLNGSATIPDVNDLESRDIAHLAALHWAPRIGRPELAASIAMRLSEQTRLALERRASAALEGKQDR